MLTLPADLTEEQKRAIDALVHTALTGEKVKLLERVGPHKYTYIDRITGAIIPHAYANGREIPSYFTGDANARLVEEMCPRDRDDIHLEISVYDGPQAILIREEGYNGGRVIVSGYGPTPQAAVVAAYMDWKGIAIPQGYGVPIPEVKE